MARTIRDELKRKCAQAANNSAKAVLDVNDVYEAYKDVHPEEAKELEAVMVGLAVSRERLLKFVASQWQLDEEQLQSYT